MAYWGLHRAGSPKIYHKPWIKPPLVLIRIEPYFEGISHTNMQDQFWFVWNDAKMLLSLKPANNACNCRTFIFPFHMKSYHYSDVIMTTIASQITSLAIVYSTIYSDADERKHQSSASLAFVRGIHRGPVNSPHKWPVTRKMFPFDDVIMIK